MAEEIDDDEFGYLEYIERRCLACDDILNDGDGLMCDECLGEDPKTDVEDFAREVFELGKNV